MKIHYSAQYGETDVAFDTTRKAVAIADSLRRRPITGVEIVAPRPAGIEEVATVHDPRYVDAVVTGDPRDLATSAGLPGGWDDELVGAVLASTGGMRDAALVALRDHTISGSLSSGLHHARYERGSGYCTFNGLVVAARAAVDAGAERVLILDLDAHCGGGTASLITGLDPVEQVDVSVIGFDNYDSRPDARLRIVRHDEYLATIGDELASIDDPTGIDLVIYNAGMDPHENAGGVIGIDTEVLVEREAMVFDWLACHDLPCAFAMAGGYTGDIELDELVDLHRLTIECAAATK